MLSASVISSLSRGLAAWWLLVAVSGFAAPVRAQPIRHALSITYEASDNCPTKEQFLAEVYSRLGQESSGQDTIESREFHVTVAEVQGRGLGTLRIVGGAQPVDPKHVEGETCAAVAQALTLAIALAIDPQAVEPPPPPPDEKGPEEPPQPGPKPPKVTAAPAPRPRIWTLGLEGISIFGFAAEPAFGLVAALRTEPPGDWHVWPDFRLGITAATTSAWKDSKSGVGATWRWLYARSEACPFRLLEAGRGRVHVDLCAALDLGMVYSLGEGLVNSRTESRIWISPGTELRIEWWFANGGALEMAAGGGFAPQRYKYQFQSGPLTNDAKSVFTTSSFGPMFSLGAAFGPL